MNVVALWGYALKEMGQEGDTTEPMPFVVEEKTIAAKVRWPQSPRGRVEGGIDD